MTRKSSRLTGICCALLAALVLGALLAGNAAADLKFKEVGVRDYSSTETSVRQAGSHSDFEFSFSIPTEKVVRDGFEVEGPSESVKDVGLELPPGLYANPTNFITCGADDFFNPRGIAPLCSAASQVGVATFTATTGLAAGRHEVGLYNLTHGPNVPAKFGFKWEAAVVILTPSVRPGDYGISSASVDTSQAVPLQAARIRLWGVPADPSHDSERGDGYEVSGPNFPISIDAPLVPFFTNPGSCPERVTPFVASGSSWEHPNAFDTRTLPTDEAGTPFIWEGCEKLGFKPRLTAEPTSRETSSPAGLSVDFTVPQNEQPYALASANVRRAKVTLPQGMAISSSSAAGLGACAQAQVGIGSNAAPTCPESSKVGSVSIKTPLLSEELEGGLYLAKQRENPFGSLLALYMIVKGPGFYLKLPGEVATDPQTGQVAVSFDETPQLPFEELKLNLKTGPRAPLVTPAKCGTYAIQTEVTPWSGTPPVKGESKFTVSEHCSTGGFAPKLRAGTAKSQAGSFSSFNLQIAQETSESNLSRLQATLPPGLLAKLKGVPLCGDAQAATGACPATSQVGSTTIGVGPGPSPLYVPEAGKAPTAVYLGGPYKGAPYSLIVRVPAQAGPFDLGTVLVRNALQIDPFTTQVTAVSDPLPQILEGIPISYRDVRVDVNRPQFIVNPTNCSQFQVTGLLTSATGQTSSPKAPFAVANCERLAFKPTLKLQLKGPTERTGLPALKAILTYPKKGAFANIARAQVNLPHSEFLEQNNLDQTCTKPVLLAGKCPKSAVYGKAKAWSPLLDKPLEGPVYLVGGFGYKLPALVADLNGQIHVILKSKVDSGPNNGLRTTFEAVPDAPVSRFVLEMKGGKKYGLLVNSEDTCAKPQMLKATFTGQNGKVDSFDQKIENGCGEKKSKSKKNPRG